jgi:aminopeptidase
VHWDMVCDLRQGGSITVDGTELQRDGKFVA